MSRWLIVSGLAFSLAAAEMPFTPGFFVLIAGLTMMWSAWK